MEDDPTGGATLRGSGPPAETESPTLERSGQDSLPISLTLPDAGYELGAMIGSGGMGEVLVAHDKRIGREVAVKRMRGRSSEAVARFLREARIQARLDHPAIVPVHELGIDAEGRPFFTMKRLAGITLLERLRAKGPLNPLLRAFVEVCRAVEFAHAKSVVHRDLKPSNIMLGDYGEVYILDWGVARVVGEDQPDVTTAQDLEAVDDSTRSGALLGTPGYMAPEQIRNHASQPAVDIYALGSILFEILTRESLHGTGQTAIARTRRPHRTHRRAGARRRPPRLDALCERCSRGSEARADRAPGSRESQAYVDGDRDLELRKLLAASS